MLFSGFFLEKVFRQELILSSYAWTHRVLTDYLGVVVVAFTVVPLINVTSSMSQGKNELK